jgi:hypothetical protein
MLHCVIGRAEFLFLQLFATIFYLGYNSNDIKWGEFRVAPPMNCIIKMNEEEEYNSRKRTLTLHLHA